MSILGLFNSKEEKMQARIDELSEKLKELNQKFVSRNDVVNNLRNELVTLNRSLDQEKDNCATLQKQIEILSAELNTRQEKIKNISEELSQVKNSSISGSQVQVVEKNLRENQRIIADYQRKLNESEEIINNLKTLLSQNNIQYDDNIEHQEVNKKKKYIYKVDIKNFYKGAAYKDALEILLLNNIKFVQDLDESFIDNSLGQCKNYSTIKKKYLDFQNKKMEWDPYTFLTKGDKIKDIFAGKRKFIKYADENYLQFMDDISDLDMKSLYEVGFTQSVIKELTEIKDKYFQENIVI